MIEFLRGKKTYLVSAIGILYIGGAFAGLYEYNEEVLIGIGFTGLGTLRAGMAKVEKQ